MLRVLILSLIAITNFVLQSTLFSYIAIGGIKPNTAIILTVSYAILRGDIEGAIFGFAMGFLQDVFFGNVLGLYALLGALVGFICGKPFKDFFTENYLLPVVLVFASMLAYEFVFYIFSFLIYGRTDFLYYFKRIILSETVYTTVLSLVIYRVVYGINRRLEDHENKKRSFFK